jgi:hypothetical protein
MNQIIRIFLMLSVSCFHAQSENDTLFFDNKYQKGSVILKDSIVGFVNTFIFLNKLDNQPVTGCVVIKGKKHQTHYQVNFGVVASSETRSKKTNELLFYEEYLDDGKMLCIQKYKKNQLQELTLWIKLEKTIIIKKIKKVKDKYILSEENLDKTAEKISDRDVQSFAELCKHCACDKK